MADTYSIVFIPRVLRTLEKLPQNVRTRIIKETESLRENPHPPGSVKIAGEEGTYRVVVGDYRVLYQVQHAVLVVLVVKVGHRREVYRRL